jgi:hypothetical protein
VGTAAVELDSALHAAKTSSIKTAVHKSKIFLLFIIIPPEGRL